MASRRPGQQARTGLDRMGALPFDDSRREQGIMNQYPRPPRPSGPPRDIGFDRMGSSFSPSYGDFPPNTLGLMQGDIRDTHHYPSSMRPHELQHKNTPSIPRHWRSNDPVDRNVGIMQMAGGSGYWPTPMFDWEDPDYTPSYISPSVLEMDMLPGMGITDWEGQWESTADPYDWSLSSLGMGGQDESQQMAKIYNNQMPGMIDEGFFWDSVAPQGEAINKVLNMPGIEGMRQGSESDWNYDDYNKMIPDWLREQLPEDAFENLYDFRNQQRITT